MRATLPSRTRRLLGARRKAPPEGLSSGRSHRRGCGLRSDGGQSTVEYLVVLLGVVAVVIGLGALVRVGASGVLARLAGASASHVVGGTSDPAGALLDVLMY